MSSKKNRQELGNEYSGVLMKKLSVISKLQIGITALVLLSSISSIVNYIAYKKVASAYNEFTQLNQSQS